MRTETNTWTGSGEGRFNEDFALVSEASCCAVLVDGATGLTKANVVAGESDAAWYARTLAHEAVALLADPEADAFRALCDAGARVAKRFFDFDGAAELRRIDQPNGSLAALRWSRSVVEAALLGDCVAAVLLRDGSCHVLHDDTLSKLDDENYERMYRYATEHGTTMAEARRALNPRFIENRLKMNEPGGYWAADVSCRGFAHTSVSCFDKSEVSALFACSDGYANAVAMGATESLGQLARLAWEGKGAELGERLRELEGQDGGCWRVHRSKTSDDATYALVDFRQ